jgi:hypothetical protein
MWVDWMDINSVDWMVLKTVDSMEVYKVASTVAKSAEKKVVEMA